MRQLTLFGLVVFVGLLAVLLPWFVFPAGDFVWPLRFALPPLALGAIGFTAWRLLKSRAPDYLSWVALEGYFERGGLAFAFRIGRCKRQAYLYVYFQNQYERPCEAEVAIRPTRWFYEKFVPLDPIRVRIECGPAACGVARVPFSVPRNLQGKRLRFDVGADVAYPYGRGRCLRYAIALPAERNAELRLGSLAIRLGHASSPDASRRRRRCVEGVAALRSAYALDRQRRAAGGVAGRPLAYG